MAIPLAYLLTFRSYGTWLHGDARGSVDRRGHNVYEAPRIAPNPQLEKSDRTSAAHPPVVLDAARRAATERAVREVCAHRGFHLRAVNVRTNHVHVVVTAGCRPEVLMNALKSYATRRLRELGLLSAVVRPWARHGSTRYLWEPRHVERAIDYVLNGQGEGPPDFI